MKKLLSLFVVIFTLAFAGCSNESSSSEGDKTKKEGSKIVTTTGQISDTVKEIVGDHLEVVTLMGPGVDPHLYKATQSDLERLESADAIFYNGLHLEAQMEDVLNEMAKEKTVVAVGDQVTSTSLLADEANSELYDPHIWFDIEIWKQVTETITDTLVKDYPDYKEDFEKNEAEYITKLVELQEYATNRIQDVPENQRVLVTAHDAFNYFAQSQNFEVRGLQGISTEAEYGVKDVQNMVTFLVDNKIKAVFVESSVSDKAINAVIEGAKEKGHDVTIGGELYSDAMGAEGTEEGTYIGMYKYNIDTIVDALK